MGNAGRLVPRDRGDRRAPVPDPLADDRPEGGAVGAAYLAAVFISNLPESISSSSGLVTSGWQKPRIHWMWVAIALVLGVASLAG